jgi:hypothetical protein
VQVRCNAGVAIHIGPEPCAGIREEVGEASVREHIGQPLSRESIPALLNLSGLPGVRVDRPEVELPRDQENDGLDSGQAPEAVRAALGSLEQAIDGLAEAVGLSGLRPGHDAFHVVLAPTEN